MKMLQKASSKLQESLENSEKMKNLSTHDYFMVFVGDLNIGTRTRMRARILAELFPNFKSFSNVAIPFIAGVNRPSLLERVSNKLRRPHDSNGVNKALKKFEIIWIEKSTMMRASTLRHLKRVNPSCVLVSVSEDDMIAKHNYSAYYAECLPLYDIVFTTKTYNIEELKDAGAQKVLFFQDSFAEDTHFPLTDHDKVEAKIFPVSFVGTFESERAESVLYLANHGVQVHIFGNGWDAMAGRNDNLIIYGRPVYADEYRLVINQSLINLGFLRKINRDVVTNRSIEIPACGAFMLAERTDRHLSLFQEGTEAEFFSSNKELLNKVQGYLSDPQKAITAGRNAYKRCNKSKYDMRSGVQKMLHQIRLLDRT